MILSSSLSSSFTKFKHLYINKLTKVDTKRNPAIIFLHVVPLCMQFCRILTKPHPLLKETFFCIICAHPFSVRFYLLPSCTQTMPRKNINNTCCLFKIQSEQTKNTAFKRVIQLFGLLIVTLKRMVILGKQLQNSSLLESSSTVARVSNFSCQTLNAKR